MKISKFFTLSLIFYDTTVFRNLCDRATARAVVAPKDKKERVTNRLTLYYARPAKLAGASFFTSTFSLSADKIISYADKKYLDERTAV